MSKGGSVIRARSSNGDDERAEQHAACGRLVDEGVQRVNEQQILARRFRQ